MTDQKIHGRVRGPARSIASPRLLRAVSVLLGFAFAGSARAQIVPCTGDDTIFTGKNGTPQEWIQVRAGQACEMSIEIGPRQRSIDVVRVFKQGALGRAATSGRNMVMYQAGASPGKDRFEIGIGIIGPNGGGRLFRRTVNVDVVP
ncbi:MAG: hypothetical protein KGM42_06315 [Hyphomicrobiales bacterium]|nr:hypothetical protein [Hyphomicrobiales bacterium]